MAFDLFFVVAQSEDEAREVIRQSRPGGRAATSEEEIRMRRLVSRLLEVSPDALVHPHAQGFAHGVWVGEGDFPDFDIGPQCVFCSFHPLLGPEADQHMRDLIAMLEPLGYLAFDPQEGRAVTSKNFSFRGEHAQPLPPARTDRPWWKFW